VIAFLLFLFGNTVKEYFSVKGSNTQESVLPTTLFVNIFNVHPYPLFGFYYSEHLLYELTTVISFAVFLINFLRLYYI